MILKIKTCEDTKLGGDIGTYYIKTDDSDFIEDVQLFVCPIRLIRYISKEKDIIELITDEEIKNSKVDLTIDLSSEMNDILKNLNTILDVEQYIKDTDDELDVYGEVFEESDLTYNTNRGYEMNFDNNLYHAKLSHL